MKKIISLILILSFITTIHTVFGESDNTVENSIRFENNEAVVLLYKPDNSLNRRAELTINKVSEIFILEDVQLKLIYGEKPLTIFDIVCLEKINKGSQLKDVKKYMSKNGLRYYFKNKFHQESKREIEEARRGQEEAIKERARIINEIVQQGATIQNEKEKQNAE